MWQNSSRFEGGVTVDLDRSIALYQVRAAGMLIE